MKDGVRSAPLTNPPERLAAVADCERAPRLSGGASTSTREAAARSSPRASSRSCVFNKDYRGARTAGDERLFAEAAEALGCSLLALREKANMQGLLDMGATRAGCPATSPHDDEAAVDELEKDWCVVLRDLERPARTSPSSCARRRSRSRSCSARTRSATRSSRGTSARASPPPTSCVVGDLFLTATAALANVVLPLSSAAETSGTDRRTPSGACSGCSRAIPPAVGMETWEILCEHRRADGLPLQDEVRDRSAR